MLTARQFFTSRWHFTIPSYSGEIPWKHAVSLSPFPYRPDSWSWLRFFLLSLPRRDHSNRALANPIVAPWLLGLILPRWRQVARFAWRGLGGKISLGLALAKTVLDARP
jgi:hypothetical protein